MDDRWTEATSGITLPCIVCNKKLEGALGGNEANHPDDALAFAACGHYGSTVFDPMDGSRLEANICDACLIANADKLMLFRKAERPAVKMTVGCVRQYLAEYGDEDTFESLHFQHGAVGSCGLPLDLSILDFNSLPDEKLVSDDQEDGGA